MIAGNDINVLDDVIIQRTHASISVQDGNPAGETFIENKDAIRFSAGENIIIGSASNRTGDVVIGAEFGDVVLAAGDTNKSFSIDVNDTPTNGNITIAGGLNSTNDLAFSTQIGYRIDEVRGANNTTRQDYREDDGSAFNHARNGNISVYAVGDITISGAKQTVANTAFTSFGFAQIGHGGEASAANTENYDIANAKITVTAGITDSSGGVQKTGSLTINGGDTEAAFAQIGHGAAVSATDQAAKTGDISGDIRVTLTGNLKMNDAKSGTTDADGDDEQLAQIGHGSHLAYTGSGQAGDEIVAGMITGDITVNVIGDLIMGTTLNLNTSHNRATIKSQIGHGHLARLYYNGMPVTSGGGTLSVNLGNIANFLDISDETDSDGKGSDINVMAASVTLNAINTTRNSAGSEADVIDNLQHNQIGHGGFVRYTAGGTAGSAATAPSGTKSIPSITITNDYDGDGAFTSTNLRETQSISGDNIQTAMQNALTGTPSINNTSDFLALSDADKETALAALSPWQYQALMNLLEQHATNNAAVTDAASIKPVIFGGATQPISIDLNGDSDTNDILNESETVASFSFNFDQNGGDWESAANALGDNDKRALSAYLESLGGSGNPTATASNDGKLDISVTEGDIAGNITVYDTNKSVYDSTNNPDARGVKLEANIKAGLTAITRDVAINRIGHGTANYIFGHNGYSAANGAVSHDAGKVTIKQANILGANIIVDTVTQGTATTSDDADEADNQDIELISTIGAGLAKAENNTALSNIGHGGEIFVKTGGGGTTALGNYISGNGGDIDIIRGTIWDGVKHFGAYRKEGYYSYGGAIDYNTTSGAVNAKDTGGVNVTLRSSDQVIFTNQTKAALSKAEANNTFTQAGHGSLIVAQTGNGEKTGFGGSGGRGGDIKIDWDDNKKVNDRDYGHSDHVSEIAAADDYARGIMGDIFIFADHDGNLTGTVNSNASEADGYALDMTAQDAAALSKADHNTNIAQAGHGDFFELITGEGGGGGDLNGDLGQTNGGRGGDIDIELADMKIESDILVDVKGAIRGESIATNALSPQKHGLIESLIGHSTRAYAVAGNGGNGGEASASDRIVGYDPDTADDGSKQATLRGTNGEILRGGSVGGDGGDVTIEFGDITDRYTVSDTNGNITYHHDGYFDLVSARLANDGSTATEASGDSQSDIVIFATHNESMTSAAHRARSVYLHSEVTHALSEGLGTEVNAQIGHAPRIQAQGGVGGAGGSNGNEQVNFNTLQADFSGGNGGDVTISNAKIIGDITVEPERQAKLITDAGHEKETVITASIGHSTHLVAVTTKGGNGGDVYSGLGNTDNNVQEYWETTVTSGGSITLGGDASETLASNGYTDVDNLTVDIDGDGVDDGTTVLTEADFGTDFNGDGDMSGQVSEADIDFDANGDGDKNDATVTERVNNVDLQAALNRVKTSGQTFTTREDLLQLTADQLDQLTDAERLAYEALLPSKTVATGSASAPRFTLVLQDLNKDDQHTLGDNTTLGTNGDAAEDNDSYHDDGIGILVDGNDAVDTDKEVKTATYGLLFGTNVNNDANGNVTAATTDSDNAGDGIDQNLSENATTFYKAGVNPTNTVGGGSGTKTFTQTSDVQEALMVHDKDGNPQFILVTDTNDAKTFYVANTTKNQNIINNNARFTTTFDTTTAGTTFDANVDGNSVSQFTFFDGDYATAAGDETSYDLTQLINRSWVYNTAYEGSADDISHGLFTYVDLNMDGYMDLVDFDADGKFDVVDIDQNGVYDRIDGRMANTGTDANGNANIIDYTNTTGIDYSPLKIEGGWSVADLSNANGGRGGNATASVSYTQGDINVFTGNVNFAQNEAYDGTNFVPTNISATGETDSLVVETNVEDNIVSTGGTEDTVISRIGHGAYQYVDTGAEYSDNKVGRTVFLTDTDKHDAAEGGDAGKHALKANGGDGGDGYSNLGGDRKIKLKIDDGSTILSEIDHLVGDININTRMSKIDNAIVWDAAADSGNGNWVRNGGYAFVADAKGDGIVNDDGNGAGTNGADSGSRNERARNESTANRVVVKSTVDNAKGENIGIAQIGHGAISIVDATEAKGGDGESGNGSEIEAHQTEIANGGAGGDATSVAHHLKGDITVFAGRAPDPDKEITSIEILATEGQRIVPGSSGDIVVAQVGHGRIGYAGSGEGGESDDAQWIANGGRGGDAASIQREILDASIILNASDLFGHGMDLIATALQGRNHIVRAQVGMGDINFAESNAGGDGAQSRSSVVEQWNQQVNGGRGGDAVALQAGYQYDVTVDVGAAPDTTDADKSSLRVMTNAANIFLGTENHILASIGHGGYSHADSTTASGGDAGNRSALGGISVGNSETPFKTYASYRSGGRGGNATSEIGLQGTGRALLGREAGSGEVDDKYADDHITGANITVRTHDKSYDSIIYTGIEHLFNFGNTLTTTSGNIDVLGTEYAISNLKQFDASAGAVNMSALTADQQRRLRSDAHTNPSETIGRYDGIKVEAIAGPGDNHTRAVDTNTAQIGHSGFNRADALAGEGISDKLAFGRIKASNADGGKGIQSIFSAKIQEGDGGNGGDAVAFTGSIEGNVIVTNVVTNEANDVGSATSVTAANPSVTDQDEDTNIVVRSTGGTVAKDHRVDARIGHNVASEALTDSNGGNAARPPQPVISFIAAVSARAGGAGDALSTQGVLDGDITVEAENSVIVESKKTTLGSDWGFYAGVGHRLENDLEALGQGGISGMIDPAGTVMQATFKDDGDDDRDDATEIGSNKADEQGNLLATYRALYEVKQRINGTWVPAGTNTADAAVNYTTAFSRLSEYEKSLVAPVLGDPLAHGEGRRAISSETASVYAPSTDYYDEHRYPLSLITTYDGTDYNGSENRHPRRLFGENGYFDNQHRSSLWWSG